MKKSLFFLFFLLPLIFWGQEVSVEMSISWKPNDISYLPNKADSIPFLDITYKNKSEDSLYFLKLLRSENDFLPTLRSATICGRGDKTKLAYHKHSGEYYTVVIPSATITRHSYCEVIPGGDLSFLKTEHSIDWINDNLSDISDYVELKRKTPPTSSGGIYFEELEIGESDISENIKNLFVFLEPHGKFTESFNLLPFQLVEGNFNFIIDNESNFRVELEPILDIKGMVKIFRQALLPSEVDGYRLYRGTFEVNELNVSF